MKKLITSLILGILLITNAQLAFAEDTPGLQPIESPEDIEGYIDALVPSQDDLFLGSDKIKNGEVKLVEKDLEQEVAPRVLRIVVQFSAIAGLILMVFAGVRLILARDNEEEVKKAKDTLVYALVGVIVISGSFAIIVGILRIFDNL